MITRFISTSLEKVSQWSSSRSLWYFSVAMGCCADELGNSLGSRYDIERFGIIPQSAPQHSDLLIVSGVVTPKAAVEIKKVYAEMLDPKYVLAIGACACSGGIFKNEGNYPGVLHLNDVVSVDVYIPGCPPRPEAIMNGLVTLQEKISEI